MLFQKLYHLNETGLNEKNGQNLFDILTTKGTNEYVRLDEIKSVIKQKTLIGKVIDYLIEKEVLIDVSENKNLSLFQIITETESQHEKEFKNIFLQNKLLTANRESIINKLQNSIKNEEDGYLIFLDLANSTIRNNDNLDIRKEILEKDFPKLIIEVIKPYFNAKKGYMIKNYGDEAWFYFFTDKDRNLFIRDLINNYHNLKINDLTLLEKIEKFNIQSRNLNKKIEDSIYLKIFFSNSKTTPFFTINHYSMPDFMGMNAFTFISRVEKKFKEKILKENIIKDIYFYFIVSNKKIDDNLKIKNTSTFYDGEIENLETQDGQKHIYYYIN